MSGFKTYSSNQKNNCQVIPLRMSQTRQLCESASCAGRKQNRMNVKSMDVYSTFAEVVHECPYCGYKTKDKYLLKFDSTRILFDPNSEPEATMVPVESEVIAEIGYNRVKSILYIKFTSSDKVYRYESFPGTLFLDFLNADGKGKFYNEQIRGVYYSSNSNQRFTNI